MYPVAQYFETSTTVDLQNIDFLSLLEAPNTLIKVELSSDTRSATVKKESNRTTPPFGIWFNNLPSKKLLGKDNTDNCYQAFYISCNRNINHLKEQARLVRLAILDTGEPTYSDIQQYLHRMTELQCEVEMTERLLKEKGIEISDVEYMQNLLVTLHSEVSHIRKKTELS